VRSLSTMLVSNMVHTCERQRSDTMCCLDIKLEVVGLDGDVISRAKQIGGNEWSFKQLDLSNIPRKWQVCSFANIWRLGVLSTFSKSNCAGRRMDRPVSSLT
jgi:hypothetical protein